MEPLTLNKALRAQWQDAGYVEVIDGHRVCRMGSAEVCPPPAGDLVRVYHVTSAHHAVNDLALRRLKVARLAELNDPFEFMWVMWRHLDLRDTVQAWKSLYDGLVGFLCFSSDWTNPVLWSHYGDKHRGVCLGFDVPRSEVTAISYEARRLDVELPSTVTRLPEQLERQLLYTKYEHWSYERELRMSLLPAQLPSEGSLRFCPFSSSLALREVILGDQCPLALDAVRELASSICTLPVTYRARLAGKSYSVVPDLRRPNEQPAV